MNKGQIALVVGAVAVATVLYLLPYNPLPAKEVVAETEGAGDTDYSLLDDLTEVNNGLDSATLAVITRYEIAVEKQGNTLFRDSLVAVYDAMRQPVASSFHSLKKAEETNEAGTWAEAGERFLLNAKYMGNQQQKTAWFGLSRDCFEKAVELAPDNLDVKVDLGVCLVEGASFLGTAPMQGIGLLKKVEQMDPENVKALINLGYFSVKSGQFDKAEERFNSVLEADPEYIEAHLYLADLYEKQQQPQKAIEALSTYMAQVDDPQRKTEVERYIKELSDNIQ